MLLASLLKVQMLKGEVVLDRVFCPFLFSISTDSDHTGQQWGIKAVTGRGQRTDTQHASAGSPYMW
jgi:hypothetical protein